MSAILKSLGNRLLEKIMAKNYRNGNFRDIYWVIGDGRSGTTWIADLINFRQSYRKVFEPFHPQLIESFSEMALHQYIAETEENYFLESASVDVLNGRFFHNRTDSRNRRFRYDGMVVKDIYCNLMAKWMCRRVNQIHPVMVVRNPFSVALSKQKKSNWLWLKEPTELLAQPSLRQDFLLSYEDLIRKTSAEGDFIEKQILIWSIIHFVPFTQFSSHEIDLLFYEDVYRSPAEHILSLLARTASSGEANSPTELPAHLINKPTRSAGKESHIELGTSPVEAWKDELGPASIDRGMAILAAFNLDWIYGDGSKPTVTPQQLLDTFGH